ncbi:hypothetical protein F4808DRAFT_442355 [Astrocystis sublimbata]|nr:hypothetical protein F4808DRAFT_442355 [Astrocystis sublimbata]
MATKTETRTNIPMMRRERRKNSDAALNTLREAKSRERLTSTPPRPYNHDVRWDPSTGEPTTSTKGRPASVKPQEYAHGLTNRGDARPPSSGRGPIGLPPNPAALRDRLRPVRPASTNPQPAPAQRPEWNGASGRTSIVPPVKDNKNVTPLRIPPRTGKMASQGRPMLSPIESNGSGAATSPSSSVQQTHSPVVATDSPSRPSGYPTPPPSEDPVRAKPPTAQPAVQPRLRIPSNEQATRRKPTRPAPGQNPESPSPSEHVHRKAQPQAIPVRGSSRASAQPASRINVAKNANRKHITPRASSEDLSPAPTPPQLSTPTPTAKPTPEVSVLSRGRPTVSGYESSPTTTPIEAVTVKIHLDSPYYTTANTSSANTPSSGTKPHPSEPRVFTTRVVPDLDGNQSASSISSGVSHDKSLPPAPPEVSAKDRVTELNAQLEALGNRRININTAIRQMTEMMPTDNILASEAVVRKREREKKKVEHLRTELADVERQSYELGLKLHRAYKRLDRDAEYEPTTLWVRRITH